MSETLLETIQSLRFRAERLEQDAAELRQALANVADVLVSPSSVVARYIVDGESYEITQADVEAVGSGLVKPWTERALYELAAVKKVATRLRERPSDEQTQYLFKTVEAIREAALADGTALDSETEAALSD